MSAASATLRNIDVVRSLAAAGVLPPEMSKWEDISVSAAAGGSALDPGTYVDPLGGYGADVQSLCRRFHISTVYARMALENHEGRKPAAIAFLSETAFAEAFGI